MDPQSNDQISKPIDKSPQAQASATTQCVPQMGEPLDPGAVPEISSMANANVIRYERCTGQGVRLSNATAASEVMVIDESTPTPPIPRRQPYIPVGQRRPQRDEDVLYIGPE